MAKKYYRTLNGYSNIEIPMVEQKRLIRKMKAGIRKARRGHLGHFYFCAYADLHIGGPGLPVTEIICYADLINNLDLSPERSDQIYVEVPFTRKKDIEAAKKMFLEFAEAKAKNGLPYTFRNKE